MKRTAILAALLSIVPLAATSLTAEAHNGNRDHRHWGRTTHVHVARPRVIVVRPHTRWSWHRPHPAARLHMHRRHYLR